jgi:lysophospholipase L1-like esterase
MGASFPPPLDLGSARLQASGGKRFRNFTPTAYDASNQIALFATSTKSALLNLPGDATLVRFLFRSNNVTGAMTLKGYASPTTQVGDGFTACDAAGAATTANWTAMNFINAGADILPEDQAATTAVTATIPNTNTWYWSDWQAVTTLPRIDGGFGRLLLVRTQASANPSGVQMLGTGGILTDTANCGGVSAQFASNTVITTLTATDFVSGSPVSHIYGAQYYSAKPGYTMLNCGSSITQGTTTDNARSGWGRIAAKAITDATGVPVTSIYNNPLVTPTTAAWVPVASNMIRLIKPQIVTLQVANRNDPISAAQQDITWRQVLEVAQTATDNGAKVVLFTATPWNASNAPTAVEDGYRQINNNRARAIAAANGFALIDGDALVTDGASPARILSAYNASGDLTHPDDAGHARIGGNLVPTLRSMLGI